METDQTLRAGMGSWGWGGILCGVMSCPRKPASTPLDAFLLPPLSEIRTVSRRFGLPSNLFLKCERSQKSNGAVVIHTLLQLDSLLTICSSYHFTKPITAQPPVSLKLFVFHTVLSLTALSESSSPLPLRSFLLCHPFLLLEVVSPFPPDDDLALCQPF